MTQTPKMPFAECWQRLLQAIVKPILDRLDKPSIETPIPLVNIVGQAVALNTNFIVTDPATQQYIKPNHGPCIFRIYVSLSVAGVFSVQRITAAGTVAEKMNAGVALVAGAGYMFDVLVDQDEKIDFQTTVATTINKLCVVEKDDAK